jgi:hypothetical protein
MYFVSMLKLCSEKCVLDGSAIIKCEGQHFFLFNFVKIKRQSSFCVKYVVFYIRSVVFICFLLVLIQA